MCVCILNVSIKTKPLPKLCQALGPHSIYNLLHRILNLVLFYMFMVKEPAKVQNLSSICNFYLFFYGNRNFTCFPQPSAKVSPQPLNALCMSGIMATLRRLTMTLTITITTTSPKSRKKVLLRLPSSLPQAHLMK